MSEQPKFYKPYKESSMFADGTTARPIPAGTIARGHLELEEDHYTGRMNGSAAASISADTSRFIARKSPNRLVKSALLRSNRTGMVAFRRRS